MDHFSDLILVALMLSAVALLGTSRIAGCIRISAAQGGLLALLLLCVRGTGSPYFWALAGGIAVLKGIVFPWLLRRAIRETDVQCENIPSVNYLLSLGWAAVSFAVASWISSLLSVPFHQAASPAVAAAVFMIFSGFFLIVARRLALMQVLGFVTLENGVYAFGLALAYDFPFLVELGILLDIFVAVFVMGIMVFRIHRAFDHIDTRQMTNLKDEP
ncbi:MAG: hydrogenase [Candidatus Omnitrophota bacterium]|jgi:hydrogenase-4 component E